MSGSGPSGGWSPDGQQSGSSAPEMPPSSPRMPPTPSGDSVSDPVPFRRPMPPVEHDEPEEVLAPDRSELDPATESLVEQFERARQEETARTMIDRAAPAGAVAPGRGRSGDRPHRSPDAGPARARAADPARPRPRGVDDQPEGWRRQDHHHDQPRRVAGRVRAEGAAGRLRPAGLAVGRSRAEPARDGADDLQPADAAGRQHRGRRRADQRRGHGPAAVQHRPVGRRGAAGARGGARADPAARAGAGDRQVRRHPHRLPALPRPAHRQRPHRVRRRDRAARVRVLRPARRRAAQDDHRQGPRAAQPQARDRRRARHHVRRPHAARPRGHGATGPGLGRPGVPHGHPPHREVLRLDRRGRADHVVRLHSAGADAYRQLAKEVLARWPRPLHDA